MRLPEMLTSEEAAAWLRMTRGALYVQRHRGEAPGALAVRVGRRLLWRRDDIERWFDDRQRLASVAGPGGGRGADAA